LDKPIFPELLKDQVHKITVKISLK